MQEIKLELAIEDANLILEALGSLPFARVYTLIGKIQQQAAQQLQESGAATADAGPPMAHTLE
ncbi:MAG: hypothetical protein DVS81_02330 [Candidatus Accumulibacter meliphilus]|jgi:hypothetical protein|uniref:Uncharacterized protein n=1 Tax=Candidatus Accumulibacter meliphilus TaxID=2211374 RepID=A0A369XRS2_9PROT|nr:MAG: hypothetical protein DVS81_02330 [Candidatus Accumulibacter meliphilus]